VSSVLMADFRGACSAAAALSNPAMLELQQAREQMRWLERDPFDGSAEPLGRMACSSAGAGSATRDRSESTLLSIIDNFNNRSD
jgi:hypothetical protein